MTRNRKSAKAAGTRFETQIAAYLAEHLDDRIERRTKTGAKDRGDIAGLRVRGQRVVVECKNTTRASLGTWVTEAETERRNDDAGVGIVAHKRHGKGAAADQYITLTVRDLVSLINGHRPEQD